MSELMSELKEADLNKLHQELEKTYFATNYPKKSPVEIHPSVKNKITNKWNIRFIMFGIIAIFIIALFIFNRIEIDVRVISSLKAGLAQDKKNENTTYFNKNGAPNAELIQSVAFYGTTDAESKWRKEFITLSTEIPAKKAILSIDFSKPINMNNSSLRFYAKGEAGGEDLSIALRDANNNSCNSKVNKLRNSWQEFIISAEMAKEFISPENIVHVDFQVNPEEKKNLKRSRIYLKNIRLTKKGG